MVLFRPEDFGVSLVLYAYNILSNNRTVVFIKLDKYLPSRLCLLIPHVGPNGVVECFGAVPGCKEGISMKGIYNIANPILPDCM